jgi:hypothetical protein
MHLRLTVGAQVAAATLYDSPTSRDFVSLLPLTLKARYRFVIDMKA